ncbi:MAG: hypothetical protein JW811_04425 [Clostridiales bacterium]|nr:hypothetical protein [Clostridiales bacterium]
MKRNFRRGAALLLLLLWLPAGALALTGQSMSTFLAYYKENISYINKQQNRHLLPIEPEILDLGNSRKQYSSYSDTLHVTIKADAAGIIESCEIRLLYPEGAQAGNSLYLDYDKASFHCVAFIMAMHVSTDPESRAYLAGEIKNNLIKNYGVYERQLGSYTINCISVNGEGAVFTFTNDGLSTANPADGQPAEPIEEDEEANYG